MVEGVHASPIGSDAAKHVPELQASSSTFPRPGATLTLSAQLWELHFARLLPRDLSEDTQVTVGELTRVREFLAERFPSLTEEALGNSPAARTSNAKRRYLTTQCDLLELRHAQRTVGVIVGAPEDWSTYYVRIFAIAREFQRPALIRRVVRECIFEPLSACGVQRLSAETSPANRAMSRLFSELQFHVTGQQLSERWGPLVRYTKFLDPGCEAVFLQRFAGTAPRATGNGNEIGE